MLKLTNLFFLISFLLIAQDNISLSIKNSSFYKYDKNSKIELKLIAEKINYYNRRINFFNSNLFLIKGNRKISMKSDYILYYKEKQFFFLEGNNLLKTDNFFIKAKNIYIYQAIGRVYLTGDVHIKFNAK